MYIGVDIGGTNVRIGLFAQKEDTIRLISSVNFPVQQDFDQGVGQIVAHIQTLASDKRIEGIGISLPGSLDDNGVIIGSANLRRWIGRPLRSPLQTAFGVPVRIAHDVAVSAIGEALYGMGKGADRFVYVIWGTGFGGALVERLDGKFHTTSFEAGHYSLDLVGDTCPCGQRGCPELIIGGGSLNKRVGGKWEGIDEKNPLWDDVVPVASQVIQNIIMFHPASRIIFGGGLILKRPFLLDRIAPQVAKNVTLFPMPKLVLSNLGENTGIYGAVGLFFCEQI